MFSNEKALVQFVDTEEKYFLDKQFLPVNYVLDKKYKPTSKDFIGIFPRGWREFDQMILGDYVHPRSIGSTDTKISFQLPFNFSENKMTCFNADYQLIYVNDDFKVLGRSPYFKIYRSSEEKEENVVYEAQGSAQVSHAALVKSIEPELTKVLGSEVQHCREKWEKITKETPKPKCNPTIIGSYKKPSPFKIRSPLGESSSQQGGLPEFQRNYAAPRCDFCHRTNELLNDKQMLSRQLKNLAECNYDLRKKVHDLENELELSYVSQRTMKQQLGRLTFDVESYENVTKALLKNLQGYSPVCIDNAGKEIMVQRVNPETERRLMHQFNLRPSLQNERYLKAIIGNQERRIQDLTTKLLQLELASNAIESGHASNVCGENVEEDGSLQD